MALTQEGKGMGGGFDMGAMVKPVECSIHAAAVVLKKDGDKFPKVKEALDEMKKVVEGCKYDDVKELFACVINPDTTHVSKCGQPNMGHVMEVFMDPKMMGATSLGKSDPKFMKAVEDAAKDCAA